MLPVFWHAVCKYETVEQLKFTVMKRILILAGLIFAGLTASATTTNNTINTSTYINGYGNSFIFVEGGIEFSVFRDGQFDFNILGNRSNVNVSLDLQI